MIGVQGHGANCATSCDTHPINDVPDEVLTEILDRVPLEDQFTVANVCRRWNVLAGPGLFAIRVWQPVLGGNVNWQATSWSVILEGRYTDVSRIAGRLPLTAQHAGHNMHTKSSGSQIKVSLSLCRNAVAKPQHRKGRSELVSLVGKVPKDSRISTLDISGSVIETQFPVLNVRKPLSRVLQGINLRLLEGLSEVNGIGCSCLEVALLPQSLNSLTFNGCSRLKFSSSFNLNKLHTLDLTNCRNLLLDYCSVRSHSSGPTLKHLHLSWLTQLSEGNLVGLVTSGDIRTISLRGIGCTAALMALAKSAPRLQSLDVAFSSGIDESSVSELLDARESITRCNLRGCRKIDSKFYKAVALKLHNRAKASSS